MPELQAILELLKGNGSFGNVITWLLLYWISTEIKKAKEDLKTGDSVTTLYIDSVKKQLEKDMESHFSSDREKSEIRFINYDTSIRDIWSDLERIRERIEQSKGRGAGK